MNQHFFSALYDLWGEDGDSISYFALQTQSTRVSDDDDYGDEYGAGLNYEYEENEEEEEAASTGEGEYNYREN